MNISSTGIEYRRLTTPRAAAIAGILFGLLFSASLVLLRDALPEEFTTPAFLVFVIFLITGILAQFEIRRVRGRYVNLR